MRFIFELFLVSIAKPIKKEAEEAMLAGKDSCEQAELLLKAERKKKTVAVATVTFQDCLPTAAADYILWMMSPVGQNNSFNMNEFNNLSMSAAASTLQPLAKVTQRLN